MKNCNVCGTPNADSAFQCSQCGSPLPVTTSKRKKGADINWKAILLCVGAVAVVAGIIFGVFFLTGGTSRVVGKALKMNEKAASEEAGTLPNLTGYLENFEELNDDGDFTMQANITSDLFDLTAVMDYSRGDRVLSGLASYANDEKDLDITFDFSANKKYCTLTSEGRMSDIYGFKIRDFQEKFEGNVLASVVSIADFEKLDFSKIIPHKNAEEWKALKKTIRYDELNERQMQVGNRLITCKAYEIKWDKEAATRLVSSVLGMKIEFTMKLADVLERVSPDCRVYVDETGYLVAADFVAGPNKCVLTFEGNENIWEKCVIRSVNLDGSEGEIRGDLEVKDGKITCVLEWDGVLDFALTYADADGRFAIEADLLGLPWYIDGYITSNRSGSQLSFGGYLPMLGDVRLGLEMAPLANEPKMMGDKYVDLMSKDITKWLRMLIDINSSN